MIESQKYLNGRFYKTSYLNGQLALYLHDDIGVPLVELSVENDLIELAPDEIILKDHAENVEIVEELYESKMISLVDRYALIGVHLHPICKVLL